MGVDDLPRFPAEHQEAGGVPSRQGLLGHQFRRQMVVEIFDQGHLS